MNRLTEVFDIEATDVPRRTELASQRGGEVIVPDVPDGSTSTERVDQDYENARSNLYHILEQGRDALMDAIELARSSEKPSSYEVVGNMMKQLADINAQLLDLAEKRDRIISKSAPQPAGGTQVTNNNAIFVGSTAELSKMIQKMNKGE